MKIGLERIIHGFLKKCSHEFKSLLFHPKGDQPIAGRVALCLSGQPRYIDQGYYFIYKHLLSKYDIDVFIHTWWNSDYIGDDFQMTNLKRDARWDKDTLLKISKYYNPKKIKTEDQKEFDYFRDVDYGGQHPISPYSMFYSIKESNKLKTQFEIENNFKYDIVIRCRFESI